MKLYEVNTGLNVINKKMKVYGLYSKTKGRAYLNEEPFIVANEDDPFPYENLEFIRLYSSDEMLIAYKFLKPFILKPEDTIRADNKFILVVDDTDDEWDKTFPLLIQFKVQADNNGKIQAEIRPFSEEKLSRQYFLASVIFMPEAEIKLKSFFISGNDTYELVYKNNYVSHLYLPPVPINLLLPFYDLSNDPVIRIEGTTQPNKALRLIFEVVVDWYLIYNTNALLKMYRYINQVMRK